MEPTPPTESNADYRKQLGESIRVLQVIVGALAGSCVAIGATAVIALSIRDGGPPVEGPQVLTYIALGGVIVAFALAALVTQAIAASARKRLISGQRPRPHPQRRIPWQHADFLAQFGDQAHLGGIYFTKTIVAAAILEGAAYLGLGAFYVTRNPLAVAATVVAVIGILLLFPTVSRCESWIEQQLRRVDEHRQLTGHVSPTAS